MTLQFDPGAYAQIFEAAQNRKLQQQKMLQDSLSQIPQGLMDYQRMGMEQKRQDLMNQLTQGQINRQNAEMSPLVSPDSSGGPSASMDSMPPTSNNASGQPPQSMMSRFFQSVPLTAPNRPSSTGAQVQPLPSMTPQNGPEMPGMDQYASAGMPDTGESPVVQAWKGLPANHPFGAQSPQGGQPSGLTPMFGSHSAGGYSQPQNDPEAPYKKILMDPTESPIRQKTAADALNRITEEERTPYEKQGWQSGLDVQKSTVAKNTAEANKANREAEFLGATGGKAQEIQNKLEQQGRDLATKIINSRSGDFGIQNQKVSQAIHLRALMDQYKDPRTGEYKIPNAQYTELAVGMASLLSNGTQPPESVINNIRQATAQGDLNKALTYAGFDPGTLGAGSAGLNKNLSDSIDRQGLTSEQLREPVLNQIRQQMPTMLNPDVKQRIINSLGVNSYRGYLQNGGFQNQQPQGMGGSPQGTGGETQIGRFKVTVH